jgi:hypothetical protein
MFELIGAAVLIVLGAVLYHNKTKIEADLKAFFSSGLTELEALIAKGETVASADVKAIVTKLKAKL